MRGELLGPAVGGTGGPPRSGASGVGAAAGCKPGPLAVRVSTAVTGAAWPAAALPALPLLAASGVRGPSTDMRALSAPTGYFGCAFPKNIEGRRLLLLLPLSRGGTSRMLAASLSWLGVRASAAGASSDGRAEDKSPGSMAGMGGGPARLLLGATWLWPPRLIMRSVMVCNHLAVSTLSGSIFSFSMLPSLAAESAKRAFLSLIS
mmetsp:Transcript_33497/g.77849  ORF Transcript_33497/g.77849 Transcript_33497/m.77849 type:complete len:205 (-) Transcript_33497:210-824(-)